MNQVNLAPLTEEELAVVRRAQLDFGFFLEQVFARSFDGRRFRLADGRWHPFSLGAVHRRWATLAQVYNRLCLLAPRMHLKSTILNHAFVFWYLFRGWGDVDALVFGYKDQLAKEHLAITKRLIKANPYCRLWHDRRPSSDYLISFEVDFGEGMTWLAQAEGSGILSASRGRHPKLVVCDDILSDFANPLGAAQLKRIENVFRQVVMSLPDPNDPLVVVGTPQSYGDTLFKLREDPSFYWARLPAILDERAREALWPDKFDYAQLQRVRAAVKERAFQVEYLLVPAAVANAFLPREAVAACVDTEASCWSLDEPFENPDHYPVYAGMDVGKDVHPSHIGVFVEVPDGTLLQVYQVFLDHLDYRAQVKLINRVIEHFDVTRFYYDSTRAELDDRGLSSRAKGHRFTKRLKANMALLLERRVYASPEEPGIVLLRDDRMLKQLSAVTNDLESVEVDDGHGDAFWSTALAVKAAEDGPAITVLGDWNEMADAGRGAPTP
jgi:hypothetical protein